MVIATEIVCSSRFSKNVQSLNPPDQRRVEDAIRKLADNPRHPSLRTHRMQAKKDIWECYVTAKMRLIFEKPRPGEPLRLWDVGYHRVVDVADEHKFGDAVTFSPWQMALSDAIEAEETSSDFAPDPAWFAPADEAEDLPALTASPFALLPATHLRFYGVPAEMVAAVQTADDVEQVEGLPEHVRLRLLEVQTNPDLENALYDPDLLLYRTTLDRIAGFCEGRIKKLMLNLTPQQQQCVDNAHPGMLVLRGTAGSGKTTVGIYRAINRVLMGRRVLLLTYTNSLVDALRSLIVELMGEVPDELTILSVDSCLWQTAETLYKRPLVQVGDTGRCFHTAIDQTPGAETLAARDGGEFLQEEITSVILARGLTSWEEYRDAPRTGRGSPLGRQQRQIVWNVAEAYQQQRLHLNMNDWHNVALAVLSHEGAIPDALCYDDIIIDETQDVTLAKLRAVARLLRRHVDGAEGDATYWLLTDAAQTIYTSSCWWQDDDLGQNMHRLYLRRNHRNTRQIADVAATLLAHNTIRARELTNVQPERTTRNGPQPTIVRCASLEDEAQWVRARIQAVCDGTDLRFSDCAILGRSETVLKRARAVLDGARIPNSDKVDLLDNSVKILTVHSAKGLEFPLVFLMGADYGQIPNYAVVKNRVEEAKSRANECERALLYVAITRAADLLYILTQGGKESPFLAELGEEVLSEDAPPLI